MTSAIGQSIEILCNEQGLDRDMVIEAMKEAVKAAARKQFKDKNGEGIEVDWNNEEGVVEISAQKTVVLEVEDPMSELSLEDAQEMAGDEIEVGDMLLLPLPTEELGRIAAQTAKQILLQKVREAMRKRVYDEYIERVGELVNGTVKRFERGDMIVDLGGNLEAVVPRRQQSRGEMWNQGERIRVVIIDISEEAKGQQIICSRSSPELLKRLFEMEVPEIYDETVVIKAAVREPGERAKIAVTSNEKDVDPVGACVGMKGSRVQAIIKELRGEKIDIIEWSDEPSMFAANALSPARVSQVRITDIENRVMEVIVGEDQLSLAIGKKGQNVRLATRLVNWEIKIVNEDLLKQEIASKMGQMMASGEAVAIAEIGGVTPAQADALADKGVTDVEALAALSIDQLVDYLDVSMDEAEKIKAAATSIVAAKEAAISGDVADDNAYETEADESSATAADVTGSVTDENVNDENGSAETAAEDPAETPNGPDDESLDPAAETVGSAEPETTDDAVEDSGPGDVGDVDDGIQTELDGSAESDEDETTV